MNWFLRLFENPHKIEMRKRIEDEFNSKHDQMINSVVLGFLVDNKINYDFLVLHGVYYHIKSKRKYQLLDFSRSVDGLCYIQDIETLEVSRCIKEQLKPIAR